MLGTSPTTRDLRMLGKKSDTMYELFGNKETLMYTLNICHNMLKKYNLPRDQTWSLLTVRIRMLL